MHKKPYTHTHIYIYIYIYIISRIAKFFNVLFIRIPVTFVAGFLRTISMKEVAHA